VEPRSVDTPEALCASEGGRPFTKEREVDVESESGKRPSNGPPPVVEGEELGEVRPAPPLTVVLGPSSERNPSKRPPPVVVSALVLGISVPAAARVEASAARVGSLVDLDSGSSSEFAARVAPGEGSSWISDILFF